MTRKKYHITKTPDGWKAQVEGGKKASFTASTKREVQDRTINAAKSHSGTASVIIHGANGRIQEERSYPRSSDPYPPKG